VFWLCRVRMVLREDMLNRPSDRPWRDDLRASPTRLCLCCNSHNRASVAQGSSILFLAPPRQARTGRGGTRDGPCRAQRFLFDRSAHR